MRLPAVIIFFCLLEREQAVAETLDKEGVRMGSFALIAVTGGAALIHQCLHVTADRAIKGAAPGIRKHLSNIKTTIDPSESEQYCPPSCAEFAIGSDAVHVIPAGKRHQGF